MESGPILYSQPAKQLDDVFVYGIPDLIWGYVLITELERSVIQSEYFSRLLEVKQMGVASVSFPGAVHHRYEHCIGVMHVADQLLWKVRYRSDDNDQYIYLGEHPEITAGVRQCLRLAGLLHDVGHPPLSHVIEEALRKYPTLLHSASQTPFIEKLLEGGRYSHENATSYFLREEQFSGFLEDAPEGIDLVQLTLLATGEATEFPFTLLNPLINSDLDADKLDYLKRDSHHCGFVSTYNLSDFDDAILMEDAKSNDESSPADSDPKVLILSDSVATVNTFLQSRYREIDEFHFDQGARIATQVIVDTFAEYMRSLNAEARTKEIHQLHYRYRDGDLASVIEKASKKAERERNDRRNWILKRFDKVRRGRIDFFREIYPRRRSGTETPINSLDLTPATRLALWTIVSYPPAIIEIQEQLRKAFNNNDLLIDIRIAKPPSFSLRVKLQEDFTSTIFMASDTAKGLLRDSVTNLKIHFYIPSTSEARIDFDILLSEIREGAIWATDRTRRDGNKLIGHHIILSAIKAVLDYGSRVTGEPSPWMYGQWHLQHLLREISYAAGYPDPYSSSTDDVPDPQFVKDMEILVTMGILEERKVLVNVPKGGDVPFMNVYRHDYRITNHGEKYVDEVLTDTRVSNIHRDLLEATLTLQKGFGEKLMHFHQAEKELITMRPEPTEESKKISDHRQDIRNSALGEACLMVP